MKALKIGIFASSISSIISVIDAIKSVVAISTGSNTINYSENDGTDWLPYTLPLNTTWKAIT
jgi:hypothetical protein